MVDFRVGEGSSGCENVFELRPGMKCWKRVVDLLAPAGKSQDIHTNIYINNVARLFN